MEYLDKVLDQFVSAGFDRTDIRIRFLMDPLIHALFYQLALAMELIAELEERYESTDGLHPYPVHGTLD